MHVFTTLDEVALRRPQAITVGAFDGVHRGHHYLIQRTAEGAARLDAEVTVVTFWPPPVAVVRPGTPIQCLTLPAEKNAVLAALGSVGQVIVLPFTPAMALWPPEQFMATLAEHMQIAALVEGDDFSLGHNRAGTMAWLTDYGQAHGFLVERVARQISWAGPIASAAWSCAATHAGAIWATQRRICNLIR